MKVIVEYRETPDREERMKRLTDIICKRDPLKFLLDMERDEGSIDEEVIAN